MATVGQPPPYGVPNTAKGDLVDAVMKFALLPVYKWSEDTSSIAIGHRYREGLLTIRRQADVVFIGQTKVLVYLVALEVPSGTNI